MNEKGKDQSLIMNDINDISIMGAAGEGKPSINIYQFVQSSYDHFNKTLFNNKLRDVIITFQREKNVMGYFSSSRWEGVEGSLHEIAINPCYFITHKPLEFFQTLVHEMCHQWQEDFGKPGRGGYHNKEWANKMESIGLMPSDTGEPGGKKTGQKVSDYPIPDSIFVKECINLTKKRIYLPYVDIRNVRFESAQIRQNSNLDWLVNENDSEANVIDLIGQPFSEHFSIDLSDESMVQLAQATNKSKSTYQCAKCGDKAWGKPSLEIICAKCNVSFEKIK